MPGPGRGRWGPGRPGRGGWGPGLGPAFRPGPIIRPIGRGLGVVGAVATGVVIAATVPPRRRRYPPPRAGHIYVVHDGTPRTVKVEDAPFIIRRIDVPAAAQGTQGEVIYQIEVTMNDGYKYAVTRRYSQFDELRVRVLPVLRVVTPSFPPKHGVRSAVVGLGPDGIEERRVMLKAWLQSLVTAATNGSPALRLPLYDFLETTTYYPPEPEDSSGQLAMSTAAPAGAAYSAQNVPYAEATPYAQAIGGGAFPPPAPTNAAAEKLNREAGAGDGWGVPMSSREASDLKLAMAGPDADGKLAAAAAAEVLRSGTGAMTADLRAVWELSDIDKDGKLDRDEFAVAWYLAEKAAGGEKPPAVLPADLVPPSKRTTPTSSANPF